MPNDAHSHPGARPCSGTVAPLFRIQQFRTLSILCSVLLISFLPSCAPSIPEPRYLPALKRASPAPVPVRPPLPDGWADITSRSKQPQIKQWLINRDYSGTMVLREFQGDAATLRQLMAEEVTVAAGISLRAKVPENHPDLRVTRVPTVIDQKRNLVSYAYSEKGLLRRVVVFRKQGTIMELELMQEQSSAEFDGLTNDLVAFAVLLFDR